MTTVSNYGTNTAITITVASLASDTNLKIGRESTQIDNTSTKFIDASIEGFITVGTTITASTQINIYVWGSNDSLATTAKDTLVGTDGGRTLTSVGVGNGFLQLVQSLNVDSTTANRRYDFGTNSVATLLGGILPKFWGVFVVHNTGTALNATAGNHAISFNGLKYDNV